MIFNFAIGRQRFFTLREQRFVAVQNAGNVTVAGEMLTQSEHGAIKCRFTANGHDLINQANALRPVRINGATPEHNA